MKMQLKFASWILYCTTVLIWHILSGFCFVCRAFSVVCMFVEARGHPQISSSGPLCLVFLRWSSHWKLGLGLPVPLGLLACVDFYTYVCNLQFRFFFSFRSSLQDSHEILYCRLPFSFIYIWKCLNYSNFGRYFLLDMGILVYNFYIRTLGMSFYCLQPPWFLLRS